MSPAPPSDVRFELVRAADCDGEELRTMLALLQSEHPRWPAASISVDPLDHLRWKSEGPGGEGLAIRGFAGSELVATDEV